MELFSIKGAQTDPELQVFADKLADEKSGDSKIPAPTSITNGVQCYYTTTMIVRKHLPEKYLAGSLFPYLVCPGYTEAGMVLPEVFWPEHFINKFWSPT
jgi:hypothetical protein